MENDCTETDDEQIAVLTGGLQWCPVCFNQLSLRSMPGFNEKHWYCKSCGTEWRVEDLIEALNYNELEE